MQREKIKGTASPLFVKSDEHFNKLVAALVEIEAQTKRRANKSDVARGAIIEKARRQVRSHPELKELIAAVAV